MRAFKRYARAGFTLVELMIVVAIIGILAALAIYGVRRYLQSAKTSEAKNTLGAIARGAVGAYDRETTAQEVVSEGSLASQFAHDVCASANNVPDTSVVPVGQKYQPNSTPGSDYERGDVSTGWKCLKHTVTSPSYYMYGYNASRVDGFVPAVVGVAATTAPAMAGVGANEFLAFANGDLDGDSTFSAFGQRGRVNTSTKTIKLATEIEIIDEYE